MAVAGGEEAERGDAVLRRLLSLAWPIVLARLGVMAMGVTDAVVVGRFSSRELGFHALGWAPTSVVLVGAIGLLQGVQVMTARRIGEGRPELAGAVLRRGLVYALWIGVASTAVLMVGGPAFLRAMQLDPGLTAGASRALQVFALSLTPYLLACAASLWLEGLGHPGPGTVAMWLANLVNVGLNLLFVPGAFGMPAGGAVGAGWATLGARTALLLMLLAYIAWMPRSRAFGVFARPALDRMAEREQRQVGYGAGLSYTAEAGAFAGMNIVAGWISPLAVAAWAIVLNVSAVVFMVPLGIAGATSVLVGNAWGAGDLAGVRRAALAGFALCVAFACGVALIVWPGAFVIARAYAADPALIALAAGTLVLATVFFPPDALQVVAAQALRARGDVLWPTVIHTLCYALLMLPLGWTLAHPAGLGLHGVIWAAIVASYVVAALLMWRFARLTRGERAASGA